MPKYEEAVTLKMASFLTDQGFDPADCDGYALSTEELRADNSLGILGKQRIATGLFGLNKRRLYLGNIWFRGHGGANDIWVLEAQGRDSVPALTHLAAAIERTFGVEIKIRLVTETSRFECFSSDNLP